MRLSYLTTIIEINLFLKHLQHKAGITSQADFKKNIKKHSPQSDECLNLCYSFKNYIPIFFLRLSRRSRSSFGRCLPNLA